MRRGNRRLLFRSLDTDIGEKGRLRLEKALAQSESLRRQKSEIEKLRRAVAVSASDSFRPQFADRVIRRLQAVKNQPLSSLDAFRFVFRRLTLVTVLLLIALISYNAVHSELLPKGILFYLPEATVVKILNLPVF